MEKRNSGICYGFKSWDNSLLTTGAPTAYLAFFRRNQLRSVVEQKVGGQGLTLPKRTEENLL